MEYYSLLNSKNEPIAVLHFGLGLLGNSIKTEILSQKSINKCVNHHFDFKWSDVANHENTLNIFFDKYSKELEHSKKIIIVWSAGKIGFSADSETVQDHFKNYQKILLILSNILKKKKIPNKFILLSSAGGLFEGQIGVTRKHKPMPLRPYGEVKLMEENFASQNDLFDKVECYRISTVYSTKNHFNRKGLIQVLLENGIKNKESTIFGDESTLRDYILDKDIGRFIHHLIYSDKDKKLINYLVNGKPRSIYEIKFSIERLLQKKLYIIQKMNKVNANNISFCRGIADGDFKSSNFDVNLNILKINLNI